MNLNLSLSQQNDRTLVSRDYNEGVRNDADEDNEHSDYESYTDGDDEAEISLGSSSSTDVEEDTVIPFWNVTPKYKYINWKYPDQEMDEEHLQEVNSWVEGDPLFVGLYFDSKEDVKNALKHCAMKIHQSYFVTESKPTCLYVKCLNHTSGCPWRVRASLLKNSNKWKITRWGGSHTCVNMRNHQKLDSDLICSCILGMVNEEPSVHISLIQERICAQFGYKISYKKAWKAKQKAIVKVFGDWDESYATLPRWLEYMQLNSPGSVYKLKTKEYVVGHQVNNRYRVFERLFWSFEQCHEAFKFCKPILQVDGTFLYGETLSAWEWFLALIRLHVTDRAGICLISDRHQSIKGAVSNPHIGWQPPNAYHVYCIRHIASNFNHRFKNIALKKELIKLGYTPSKVIFQQKLTRFRNESEDIERWIDSISKEKWAISNDDEGRRYGHMTTNLSKSVNKVFKGARNLPICALVKATYGRLVEYFVKRGEEAMSDLHNGSMFCRKVMLQIQKNQQEASSHQVRRYDIQRKSFEVEEAFNPITQRGGHKWTVILDRRFYECGRFQSYRFPCSHVIAACIAWKPLGNECNILTNCEWKLMPDVDRARGKGRPKSTRIRNEIEWVESQTRQRCSKCNEVGHNRRHCPQQNNVG
ncbi:uncharacterized protein LOC113855290 [Abrus precatorius]|uniref:Uncharacterized protein LOC113855290 n=1 Tax=Abrus precatorius TaxID=3816 RepID=A0A8B8KHF7_ABRPR|nr:uncharacterized protein LOC113855290 [Abrus precatorius]